MRKNLPKPLILIIISVSLLLSLTVWFSANAIVSQLESLWTLTETDLALFSMILIFGFVLGGIISAIFNLSDIVDSTNFYSLYGILAGISNLTAIFAPNFAWFLFLRFMTGFFLAGVYPTAMKLMASWFKESRGLALGILLGALTVGSGFPYVFNLTGFPDWKILMTISSVFAFFGALLVFFLIQEGPHISRGARFKISNIKRMWSKKSVRLANLAYFGHMWELYAFWVWIPIFLKESFLLVNPSRDPTIFFSLSTFLVFLMGAIGNIFGGRIADKIGRTGFNIIMLGMSGLSSIVIGFFYQNPIGSLVISLIWGLTVVPDSPQFSVMITELGDPAYLGTTLTMQTTIGFGISIISIRLLPIFVNLVGWSLGFTLLIIGPLIGIISLFILRKEPDSIKIANGKK